MNDPNFQSFSNHRILIVDDNPSIHDDFDKILDARHAPEDEAVAMFLGEENLQNEGSNDYLVVHAFQGREGVKFAKDAVRAGRPFAVAFVDMRMPPGWDGLRTIQELWKVDPDVQVVICTAYSDQRWRDLQNQLGKTDKLLILKKPFDCTEVSQLAVALTEKWCLQHELVQARDHALRASEAKSDFVASMSHELRTPLNGLLGMTQLLAGTNLDSKQTHYLNACRSSGESLLRVIGDILDFSKIEAGEFELDSESVNLVQLVEGVVQSMGASYVGSDNGEELELACYVDPCIQEKVCVDAGRLRQILFNLVGNAMKFTERGSVVTTARTINENADRYQIVFAVEDTGIGIANDKMEDLFDAFSQVDSSTTRKFGGTGLGLSISQQLVQMMGGQIEVTSVIGTGSTFSFQLDLAKASQTTPSLATRKVIVKPLHIGLIGLSSATQGIVKELLGHWNVSCELFGAVRCNDVIPDPARFDYILIDYANDGETLKIVCRKLHEFGCDPVNIIPVCQAGQEIHEEEVRRLGVLPPLLKPISQSRLFDQLFGQDENSPKPPVEPVVITRRAKDFATQSQGNRVMLVEDNEINQLYAENVLEDAGFRYVTCHNGKEAIDWLLVDDEFNAILMDCHMPVMDGFSATRRLLELTEQGLVRSIPVIALTANAQASDRKDCIAAGMTDYISKPFDTEQLVEILDRCIAKDAIPEQI